MFLLFFFREEKNSSQYPNPGIEPRQRHQLGFMLFNRFFLLHLENPSLPKPQTPHIYLQTLN
jgi:hypothetical protein